MAHHMFSPMDNNGVVGVSLTLHQALVRDASYIACVVSVSFSPYSVLHVLVRVVDDSSFFSSSLSSLFLFFQCTLPLSFLS